MKISRSLFHSERGTALVATLLFLLAMGVLSTALVFTVENDMKTSSSYKYNQQALYQARAGVQNAVRWFAGSYTPTTGTALDTSTTYPVQFEGKDVLLAGKTGSVSVYPSELVAQSFNSELGNRTLEANSNNSGTFSVNATLMKHRAVIKGCINTSTFVTFDCAIERWRLDSLGIWGTGSRPLGVSQITATVENNGQAFFDRALWGKDLVNLRGAMLIDSYNPRLGPWNPATNFGYNGAIGSNGMVDMGGSSTVRGDIGLGPSAGYNPGGTLTGGVVRLTENRDFPPIAPFAVGTRNEMVLPNEDPLIIRNGDFNNMYGRITVRGTLIFESGTYYIDELLQGAQGKIFVSGDTRLYIKSDLALTGQGILNYGMNPSQLTIVYAGSNAVAFEGGSSAYVEFYGPNADLTIRGNVDFSGSFVANNVIVAGGAMVHYSNASLEKNLIPQPFRLITWSQDSF